MVMARGSIKTSEEAAPSRVYKWGLKSVRAGSVGKSLTPKEIDATQHM